MPQDKPGSTVNTTTQAPASSVYSDLSNKASSLGLTERDMATLDPGLLMEATYNKDQLKGMPEYGQTTAGQLAKSRETLSNTPMPSASLLRPLENALKTKESIGNQEMGESELYGKAGLTGYSVLSQSLSERSREMDDTYRSFSSMMETTGGALSDAYNQTLNTYQLLKDEYDQGMKQFQGTLDRIQAAEDAMAMLAEEDAREKEMYEWKKQIDAQYAGNPEGTYNEGLGGMDFSSSWDDPKVTEGLAGAFYQAGMSDYPEAGWGDGDRQCAEGSNDITDGPKLGSYYADKMKYVTKRDNPQPGNQFVIPYGPAKYGHAGTVMDYDPETGALYTQEWNHNGDGKMTFETYNIKDLNEKYGDNWGFTDSTFKPEYQQQVQEAMSGFGQPQGYQPTERMQEVAAYGENKAGAGPVVKGLIDTQTPVVSAVRGMASKAVTAFIAEKTAEAEALIEASAAPEEEKQSVSEVHMRITEEVARDMPDANAASITKQINARLTEAGINPKTMTYEDSDSKESSGGSSLGINLDDYK